MSNVALSLELPDTRTAVGEFPETLSEKPPYPLVPDVAVPDVAVPDVAFVPSIKLPYPLDGKYIEAILTDTSSVGDAIGCGGLTKDNSCIGSAEYVVGDVFEGVLGDVFEGVLADTGGE